MKFREKQFNQNEWQKLKGLISRNQLPLYDFNIEKLIHFSNAVLHSDFLGTVGYPSPSSIGIFTGVTCYI